MEEGMFVLMMLVACSGGKDSGGLVGDATNGEQVYTDTCAVCHGADGKLGSGGAADLTVEVPAQTDDQLTNVILNGYGDMAAQDVTDQEAADCVAYLRETFGG
jgi:mono/diheme cytochrome c family protein